MNNERPTADELLAMLKDVTTFLDWHAEYHGTDKDRRVVAEARALIAKAEGGAK